MSRMSRFSIYRDGDKWRWKLISRNGRVLAESKESYNTKWGAWKSIKTVIKYIKNSDVKVE